MTTTERDAAIKERVQAFINEKDGALTKREIYEFRQIMERRTPAAPRLNEMGLKMAYDVAADYIDDKQVECGSCGCFGRRAEHFFVAESEPACNEWLAGRDR